MAIRIACLVVFMATAVLLVSQHGCRKAVDPVAQTTNKLPRTEKEFRDQLTSLRMQKDKLFRAIQRLENDKQETVDYLKEKGVKSVADMRGKPDLEYKAQNLKRWTEQIAVLQGDTTKYDTSIAAIETMLDEIERKRINDSVAVSDEDWVRMQSIVVDLNEKLDIKPNDILQDEAMDDLLQKELGAGDAGPADDKALQALLKGS